jgi:hypothetical protein
MFNRFGISDEDWQTTPEPVQKAFSALHHQLLLLELCAEAYERQLAQLRERVAQIDDLKAELAEFCEHLGRNSNNSSKPPYSHDHRVSPTHFALPGLWSSQSSLLVWGYTSQQFRPSRPSNYRLPDRKIGQLSS